MGRKLEVVPGERFGCWTVICEQGSEYGHTRALMRCECGAEAVKDFAVTRHAPPKTCRKCRYAKRMAGTIEKYNINQEGRTCNVCLNWKTWGSFANTKALRCSRCSKHDWLQRRYGISVDDFEHILASQNDKCALKYCPVRLDSGDSTPHVDHDHGAGKIRGILCTNCNLLLGAAYDDVDILISCVIYLLKTKSNKSKKRSLAGDLSNAYGPPTVKV